MIKNHFDYFAQMIRDDNKSFSLSTNLVEAKKTKNGAEITIGVPESVLFQLFADKIRVGLIVWDPDEVEKVKKQMDIKTIKND